MPIPITFIIGAVTGAAATYLYQDASSKKKLTDAGDKILDTTGDLADKAGDLAEKAGDKIKKSVKNAST